MPAAELEKIAQLLEEARRQWPVNATQVLSQAFYELWESTTGPAPFKVEGETLELPGGHSMTLPPDRHRVACIEWDFAEECASLVIEGEEWRCAALLQYNDGEGFWTERPPEPMGEIELSFGERMELVYDVMAWFRARHPSLDILSLTRKDFLEGLDGIARHHDKRSLAVMRRLKLTAIRKLLQKAGDDMAADELSNQLVLPLDGSYAKAAQSANQGSARLDYGGTRKAPVVTIAPRTPWGIYRELEWIRKAGALVFTEAEACVLPLKGAEILRTDGERCHMVRVPLPDGSPVIEGDKLPIFRRGENGALGHLRVDVQDGSSLIGTCNWDAPMRGEWQNTQLYAQPRKGPAEYLTRVMSLLVQNFRKDGRFGSAAVNALLGLERFPFEDNAVPAPPDLGLDVSQTRAWSNAVNDRNPVVLIQGPPGTGKTHVLEKVCRTLLGKRQRILMTAPSHTAVDNVCRRLRDQPVLRIAFDRDSVAPDLVESLWIGDLKVIQEFKKKRTKKECLYGGTHVAILRDDIVRADFEKNGPYDAIIFDEAGMARMDEFFLLAQLAKRVILFGDHQQLPPFPLPDVVVAKLQESGLATRRMWAVLERSALEWLANERQLPVFQLQASYRCQNPRLLRFSSTLFYEGRVKASIQAEYYQLSYGERQQRFPPDSLRFYRTSDLPVQMRQEKLSFEGGRPGIENPLELRLTALVFRDLLQRYPLHEITIITPYRRQARLLRDYLAHPAFRAAASMDAEEWRSLLATRISTVDSFQGGESDAVVISFVRSNENRGIGFVDNANRINVALTRCRREMICIGDLDCLKAQAKTNIFWRMERAMLRDGELITVTQAMLADAPLPPGL